MSRALAQMPPRRALDAESAAPAADLSADTLFRCHADDVYRMVASLLGPGAEAADIQDLTQQVFLTAHRKADRFRGDCKPQTWLYGIASRTVLTHLRSRRRHRRLVAALEAEPTPVDAPSLERAAASRDDLRRVWRCLMRVHPKKRLVWVLSEVEGLTGKEIAEALGVREATVRTRLYHARRELLEGWRRTHPDRSEP